MREAADRDDWIRPRGVFPPGVGVLSTTRPGGTSAGVWGLEGGRAGGLNLGAHVGDDPACVRENRARLAAALPSAPVWLEQVHGREVVELAGAVPHALRADAVFTRERGRVCAVMTADCLPVLIAAAHGSVVAAVHAGWRGLAAGVLEAALDAMREPGGLVAWIGPAIGAAAFEVGDEVREAFVARESGDAAAFVPAAPGKWRADLAWLARRRLLASGVGVVHASGLCTHADPTRFWSHRRDGAGGRMASCIWLEP